MAIYPNAVLLAQQPAIFFGGESRPPCADTRGYVSGKLNLLGRGRGLGARGRGVRMQF